MFGAIRELTGNKDWIWTLLAYRTRTWVEIRDKRLGIMSLSFNVIIFGYIALYEASGAIALQRQSRIRQPSTFPTSDTAAAAAPPKTVRSDHVPASVSEGGRHRGLNGLDAELAIVQH